MSTSKLQRQVSALLGVHLGQYTIRENHRPEWLDGLELDFYIEELRVGIEVQGQQHYEYVPMFHQDYDGFLAQQERDEHKADLCQHLDVALHYIEHGHEILPLVERLAEIELPTAHHANFVEVTSHVYQSRGAGGKRMRALSNINRKAKDDAIFMKCLGKAVGQERGHGINEKAKRYARQAAQRAIEARLLLKARYSEILTRILTG